VVGILCLSVGNSSWISGLKKKNMMKINNIYDTFEKTWVLNVLVLMLIRMFNCIKETVKGQRDNREECDVREKESEKNPNTGVMTSDKMKREKQSLTNYIPAIYSCLS
jgi:hypothetical protein